MQKLRSFWALIIFLFGFSPMKAQSIDSTLIKFKKEIETATNDSVKLERLFDYSRYQLRRNINESDSILKIVEKVMDKSLDSLHPRFDVMYYNQKGMLNRVKGNFAASLDYYFESLKIAEATKDSIKLAPLYHNIGGIFRLQEEHKKSLEFVKKGHEITKKWGGQQAYALTLRMLGVNYKNLKQYDSARYYNQKALKAYESIQDESGICNTKALDVDLLFVEGKYPEALPLLREIISVRKRRNELHKLSLSYNDMAYVHLRLDQLDSALHYINKSISIAERMETKKGLYLAYLKRSEIYKALNRPELSLKDFERYNELYQEVYDKEKVGQIKSLEMSFEYEKERLADSLNYANQRVLLEKDIEKRKATRWRNYAIITVLLILLLLLYLFNRKRLQLEQAEKQLLSLELVESEKKIETKEEAISNLIVESIQQIRSKKKLTENLKKATKDPSSEISVKGIIAELNAENLEDDKLLLIREQLKSQNFEFHKRLKSEFSNLSTTDLEICSFIKMGLGRNEIAKLRNTSVEAAKKSRYRIRKKMNLEDNIDIRQYLSQK
ncbi:MAG: tetratricopeptide repeat protein [Bacteroidota bacterium]